MWEEACLQSQSLDLDVYFYHKILGYYQQNNEKKILFE